MHNSRALAFVSSLLLFATLAAPAHLTDRVTLSGATLSRAVLTDT